MLDFAENLTLPPTLAAPDPQDSTVQALLRGVLLTFGVSYYKATLPETITGIRLHPDEHAFWTALYTEGMGEFYHRNGFLVPDEVDFETEASALPQKRQPLVPSVKPLILMGGGKDSAVVADLVRRMGLPAEALALGESVWIASSSLAAELPLHTIQRRIDPTLFALNAQGAFNGHVPISACIASIATLVAYANGFTDILVGNERGADEANLIEAGRLINHQWSKSSRFERLFQTWVSTFAPGSPRYQSLLRPLSEIRIAALFSQIRTQHAHFTSCNKNFRQNNKERPARWCKGCAKCVFVSLLLSPHLDHASEASIFESSLFWQAPHNRAHLEALLGLKAVKPWDCVGTVHECWLSFLAYRAHHPLPPDLEALAAEAPQALLTEFSSRWAQEWALKDVDTLSPFWTDRLHALLDTP